ncbi:hypothetical protein P9112_000928 [Eukaryota sp. TZLM1-RC]
MSCHVMTDVTRYPSATHSQSSSTKEATRSPSAPDTEPTISAMTKEIEDLRSRLSQVSSQFLAYAEASNSDTEPIQANECSTPVSFRPPDDPAEDADSSLSNSPNLPGLASFELRSSSEEDRLFEAMLSYVPYTIAPIVLETFEICYGIDPRSPSPILTHLMSMSYIKDSTPSVSLSAPTADEAVTSYITQFLKLVRLCPSPLPESARMKFFSNGIRPDKLKMVIKTDIKVGTIYSFASLVSRLRELLRAYHLAYSAYYANRDTAFPPPRDSCPPRQSSSSQRTPRQTPRNSPFRPAPSLAKPPASSHSQRSNYSTPPHSSPVTCFYCKEPGHVIKDCPKSGCKASQKPRRPLGKRPSLQRKLFTRRSVNQVTHAAPDHNADSVNSIIDSIQKAINEEHQVDATYLHGLSSSSSSSSDTEPYRATLNSFSSINHSTYFPLLHQHPAMAHQQAEDFQHLFNNLESITSALASRNDTHISPFLPPSDSGIDSSFDSLSDTSEVVSKVDSNNHMVPPGNAPFRKNGFLLLEASPDLSSEPGMIDADCARHDGGVTRGPLESHLQNSFRAKDPELTGTAPAQNAEPYVSLSAQELNKPVDMKLLHLKIYVDSQTMLNGMVDTGATVSCISRDLLKQARLKLTSKTLEVGLADKTKLSCPLASGKLAFVLGGAAKLTYVNVTLVLGILTSDYLFLNLSARNLQILEDEAIPDQYIPPSDQVSSFSSLPDLDKASFKLNDPDLESSVRSLLFKYPEIFSKLPDPEGINCPPMRIPFHDESKIVSKKFRYLPTDKLKVANEEFDTLINNGFAVPYDGPWSSPICLVQRPDKPPRLTDDYSGADGVNELSASVPADLPRIFDVCQFLSGCHYIATLDLPKALWQLNLHPDDQEKSAIAIPGRKIKYTRAAFGLKNVPAIFQNLMKKVFKSDGVFIYMDDIIVAASDKKSFLARLEFIFKQAAKYRIRIGLHKCSFQTKEHPIKVLGSIFENGQRRIDPSKIESITKLAPPTSVPEFRSFIGSVNFLRDWLLSVSAEIEPLTALLRNKPRRVRLGPSELKNFDNIKKMITSSLPLVLPDSDSNILVSTDAFEKAIAGIIWKELEPSPPGICLSERKVMPISFYSRILSASQQRWSTLQKKLFAIVMTLNQPNLSFHIEGPKNFWADYLSRASLLPEKKKEKKTRDICDNPAPELCHMMTHRDKAKPPLWNYLNLDNLRHFDTDHWYDIDYDTAERTFHPSALRSKHSTVAYLNSLKHLIHYNVNPEPYDYLAFSSALCFTLSTDLPFLYQNTSAPRDYDCSYPLNMPSRRLTVNDLIQQANWNTRIYFHHPRMPFLDYLPEVVPQNAHLVILNHIPPYTTIGVLVSVVDIFHIIPLPTYMVPFDLSHSRFISNCFHNTIASSDAKEDAYDHRRSLGYRAERASERYKFHDPRCNPQECPNSPRYDHYPWHPDTLAPSLYGEQLYDWCLHPRFLKYLDLPHTQTSFGPMFPDANYHLYFLNPCVDVTTYIPLCLSKPVVHRIYHYDNDELTPCPFAIPGLELVYGHQIDPSDRSIHYHLMPLDYSSVAEAELDNPDPDFIHNESTSCSHFPDLINLYFNGPIQHHSILDFIFQDKRLEIIPHPTRSHAFALLGYPADQPRYYLPSLRSELPSRLEVFEAEPAMFNHKRFLKEQSMSLAEDLPSREHPDQPIDISSDSSDDVHIVSAVTSSSTSDSSSHGLLPSKHFSSPAAAFLNKIFKAQQKVPDNDPLFANCLIDAPSGLKLSKSGKILVPPSMRPEILLLAHGSIEAGHPPFAQCWKFFQQSDFQWPDMRNDLRTHVNACIPCQKTAPIPKTLISSTGSLNSVRRPFESLHCDSIGPLPVDSYG